MITASYLKRILQYRKPVRTSRGEMESHTIYYICLRNGHQTGYGEAAPLPGLSIDDRKDFEQQIVLCCGLLNDGRPPDTLPLEGFPSLQFAFETALEGIKQESPFLLFESDFLQGAGIPINGLVWMDSAAEMLKQALEKTEQGFTCIKFKVGGLDFDEECRMLETFRKRFNAFRIDIRLDANGAFHPKDALEKLKELSRFDIHSIEQPIRQKQQEQMQEICGRSAVDIALDEELIGIHDTEDGLRMLQFIKPKYIILKPTLLGGFSRCNTWVRHANKLAIGWWATSALESNIGLNAIAQWVSDKHSGISQGLGTGNIYKNNLASPLMVIDGKLVYQKGKPWERPEDSEIRDSG